MKRFLLAGTAFLGLVVSGAVACATPFDFAYTGSLVDFTVPTTGTYQILAFGAQGGNVVSTVFNQTGPGGLAQRSEAPLISPQERPFRLPSQAQACLTAAEAEAEPS